MEAHTRFDINQAFVVTNQDITKIWKTFQDSGMEVKATINCSDGLVRYFQDNDMLMQYENPQRASINALEISGRCHEPYTTAEIQLGGRYSFAPVSVSIRGEESLVASMRMALTDTLDGMKPWYSRIATIDLFLIWGPIIFVLLALMDIMTPSNTTRQAFVFTKALIILALVVTLSALIVTVIWAAYWLRKRFFPAATFAIGQGLIRYQHYEQVRWVVIVGFVVSVVASIIVTVMRL